MQQLSLPRTRFEYCFIFIASVLFPVVSPAVSVASASEFSSEQIEFFEKRVRPLLAVHCYQCHSNGAEKLKAGLVVDSRDGLLKGGDSGTAIVPGKADASLLIEAVRYDAYEMPPQGKLPDADIEALVEWVNMGAPWPDETASATTPARPVFDLQERKSSHWAWQPIRRPEIPAIGDKSWPLNDVDHFILNKIEHEELLPADSVDRPGLIRRLYFDLIGLPPSIAQIQAFVDDESDSAVDLVIDELLASPHFGERWGRHWLDLVRYAESRGHEFDADAPNAYQYRDYVIRAFNADVPYDQFVSEHLAGDLLPSPRLHPEDKFNESILGTGFWFLGEWVHSPVDTRKDETDRFDNMIDVMSKAFLGVTVACARCHDHKFDAISTRDYYALSGFLQSSDYRQVPYRSLEHNARIAGELQRLDESYREKISDAIGIAADTFEGEPKEDTADVRKIIDFAKEDAKDYIQEGVIFGSGPRRAGDWVLKHSNGSPLLETVAITAATNDSFWDDLVNETEPETTGVRGLNHVLRSGRTLHTPSFILESGNVSCELIGSGQIVACVDSHRQVAGPLHGETVVNVQPTGQESSPNATRWVTLGLQRYVGQRIHLEFTPAEKQSLAIVRVVECAPHAGPPPLTQATVTSHPDQQKAFLASPVAQQLASEWFASREQLKLSVMKSSPLAIAMMDGSSEDDHVLIRGSSSNAGDVVERRFLESIDGDQPFSIHTRSGRLELAERINAPSNPLTSRVVVNRIWHHLMGRGIVSTTDDFGVLGQRPTHPELLDHLATWFVDNDRSIKELVRYVCRSRAYRLSSLAKAESFAKDPNNVWWHFLPPKRLEAETIRDALLAVSGDLDRTLYGRSVPIHLTGFMDGRGRPGQSGPLDGDRRRSIYIAVRRNFLSPFMLAFDTPSPFSTMGRRNVSNVPAQALILMNDPFVEQQAEHWAKRALETVPDDPEARIGWMYETAFARKPTRDELALGIAYVHQQAQDRAIGQDSIVVWGQLAHALMNTKEFVFLR